MIIVAIILLWIALMELVLFKTPILILCLIALSIHLARREQIALARGAKPGDWWK